MILNEKPRSNKLNFIEAEQHEIITCECLILKVLNESVINLWASTAFRTDLEGQLEE